MHPFVVYMSKSQYHADIRQEKSLVTTTNWKMTNSTSIGRIQIQASGNSGRRSLSTRYSIMAVLMESFSSGE